jgi:hypothetical protein
LKTFKKYLHDKLKTLTSWCETHLQLNTFKDVKFADNDSDSDTESVTDDTALTGIAKTQEAISELKHALRQSKCIIGGKFKKMKEKNEGL